MGSEVVRIALLGAESTGKTSLSLGIAQTLQSLGLNATVVPEVLREWCDSRGRTPLQHEQVDIAQEQAHRILVELTPLLQLGDFKANQAIKENLPLLRASLDKVQMSYLESSINNYDYPKALQVVQELRAKEAFNSPCQD